MAIQEATGKGSSRVFQVANAAASRIPKHARCSGSPFQMLGGVLAVVKCALFSLDEFDLHELVEHVVPNAVFDCVLVNSALLASVLSSLVVREVRLELGDE